MRKFFGLDPAGVKGFATAEQLLDDQRDVIFRSCEAHRLAGARVWAAAVVGRGHTCAVAPGLHPVGTFSIVSQHGLPLNGKHVPDKPTGKAYGERTLLITVRVEQQRAKLGYSYLAGMKDLNRRFLLAPDPAQPTALDVTRYSNLASLGLAMYAGRTQLGGHSRTLANLPAFPRVPELWVGYARPEDLLPLRTPALSALLRRVHGDDSDEVLAAYGTAMLREQFIAPGQELPDGTGATNTSGCHIIPMRYVQDAGGATAQFESAGHLLVTRMRWPRSFVVRTPVYAASIELGVPFDAMTADDVPRFVSLCRKHLGIYAELFAGHSDDDMLTLMETAVSLTGEVVGVGRGGENAGWVVTNEMLAAASDKLLLRLAADALPPYCAAAATADDVRAAVRQPQTTSGEIVLSCGSAVQFMAIDPNVPRGSFLRQAAATESDRAGYAALGTGVPCMLFRPNFPTENKTRRKREWMLPARVAELSPLLSDVG